MAHSIQQDMSLVQENQKISDWNISYHCAACQWKVQPEKTPFFLEKRKNFSEYSSCNEWWFHPLSLTIMCSLLGTIFWAGNIKKSISQTVTRLGQTPTPNPPTNSVMLKKNLLFNFDMFHRKTMKTHTHLVHIYSWSQFSYLLTYYRWVFGSHE